MSKDPIVEEVHETRSRLLADSGGDFQKYLERVRQGGATGGGPRVESAAELRALLLARPPR